MTRARSLLVGSVLLLIAGCSAGPRPGAPVQPAPPGPIDALRSVWGDYSGRCPNSYAYCEGDPQSICCPVTARCCEDANGAYCCDPYEGDGRYGDRYPESYPRRSYPPADAY
jgi:hypothetical protein